MAVSEHGNYVALWNGITSEVCLVDVCNSASHLLQLRELGVESWLSPFIACFSPDETLLGISYVNV